MTETIEAIDVSERAAHAISEAAHDLEGPLDEYGPRIGADQGEPRASGRILHTSADGSIEVGIWQCTPGGWEIVDRPNTETVMIVQGRATITDADGTPHDLAPGTSLTLPLGWSGRWDISETIRKVYVTVTK